MPPIYKKYEKQIRILLEQRYAPVTEFKEYLDNQVSHFEIFLRDQEIKNNLLKLMKK